MGTLLTASSTMMCPHGGQVSPVATDTSVTLGGDTIVLSTDTFPIGACPFMIGPTPHPCVQVKWIVTAMRSSANSTPPLTTDSVGLCVAADQAVQGVVMIAATQTKVSGL